MITNKEINIEKIKEMYYKKFMCCEDIAKCFNTYGIKIYRLMKKYKLKRRNRSQAMIGIKKSPTSLQGRINISNAKKGIKHPIFFFTKAMNGKHAIKNLITRSGDYKNLLLKRESNHMIIKIDRGIKNEH